MRNLTNAALLALGILSSPPAFAAADNFPAYARQFTEPQLYFTNTQALDARLKMLDMAGPGARVRISTFLMDEGPSTRTLARHLCLAASRGVDVQLIVDSKSGGQPGQSNSFDRKTEKQTTEEMYQYLANCGAHIYIHNQLRSYVDVFGHRIPNIFLDPAKNGKRFSFFELLTVNRQINHLIDRVNGILSEETSRAGVNGSPAKLLGNLKGLAMEAIQLVGRVSSAQGYEEPQGYSDSVSKMQSYYGSIVNDPFWDSVNALTLPPVLASVESRFKQDPELGTLWRELRRFNRLNHRKLFYVESGAEACAFLGGRNIGDNYLADAQRSFVDGDVLVCRHHGASAALAGALAGFEELKTDRSDPILGLANDVVIEEVAANPAFAFQLLKGSPERALGAPRVWADGLPAPGGIPLRDAKNWRYLRTGWDPASDEVMQAMHRMIRQEKREIFIETPYAEFDASMRGELEKAAQRGVRIRLITNGLFASDGASKVIRITMENWMDYMISHFPGVFEARFVSYAGKRMTHFKGAAFGCQPGNLRTFVVGSHNFDPRSGRDDKNQALTWDESANACTELANSTLLTGRFATFDSVARATGKAVLVEYPTLLQELSSVSGVYEPRNPANQLLAKALLEVFYAQGSGGYSAAQKDRVLRILSLMDAGGLHDLLGRVL